MYLFFYLPSFACSGGRVALDSLLVICGILTVGLNVCTAAMASKFALD